MEHYPEAYVEFLAHFHGTRDYFECHELLEEYWKQEPNPANRTIWHGLIQVAVGLYHERRGNYKGAYRMLESAVAKLSGRSVSSVGLDRNRLVSQLGSRLSGLKQVLEGNRAPYQDMELPIMDEYLRERSRSLCASWGIEWNRPSSLTDEALIHRHTRRDRAEVIEERRRSLARKSRRDSEGREREET